MAELLLELYSEEIPPQLQIGARNQLKHFFEKYLEEENVKFNEISVCDGRTFENLGKSNTSSKVNASFIASI